MVPEILGGCLNTLGPLHSKKMSEPNRVNTSIRWIGELRWIKELGTAKPYGFDDKIKEVDILTPSSTKPFGTHTYY